jgi:hypothetical protein
MVNFNMQLLKKTVPSPLRPILKRLILKPLESYTIHKIWKRTDPLNWPLPELREKQGINRYEYSLFSQDGEDGILRYLYSEIGFRSKLFLEFGFSVTESNSLRLMLKEGFGGVFIDGSEWVVKQFKESAQSFGISNVQAINKFLNLENLESTIIESNLPEEIDLLSIDVDGNDYWFWEGIRCLSPRIVVIEYNASLGPELSLTVPYDPNFDRHQKHKSGFYHGTSITALERLGKKKGYALVGCSSNGVNAFFVRKNCLTQNLNVLSPQSAYRLHRDRLKRGYSFEDQFRIIKDLPFTNIE